MYICIYIYMYTYFGLQAKIVGAQKTEKESRMPLNRLGAQGDEDRWHVKCGAAKARLRGVSPSMPRLPKKAH